MGGCLCMGVIHSNPAASQIPSLHSLPPSHPTKQLLGATAVPRLIPTQGWRASLSYSKHLRSALSCPLSILPSPELTRLPRKCWKGFSASLCKGFREPEKPPTDISRSKSPETCHGQQPPQHHPHHSAVKSTFPQS